MPSRAVKVAAAIAVGAAVGALVAGRRPGGRRKHRVVRGVTIDRPPAQVFEFLRDWTRLRSALDERASKWASETDLQIVDQEPGSLLSWRALKGPVPHVGWVRLAEAPNGRGTELMVVLSYQRAVSGRDLDLVLRTNLRRAKQMLEAGTIIDTLAEL